MSSLRIQQASFITFLRRQDRYAPRTLERFNDQLHEFAAFIESNFPDIQDAGQLHADAVEAWYIGHDNWSPATRNLHVVCVRSFLQYLADKSIISATLCDLLASIKTKRRINEQEEDDSDRVYTPEQLLELIQLHLPQRGIAAVRDQAVIALMAATGMRASEVCWMTIGQFYDMRDKGSAYVLRKGQHVKRVFMARFAAGYVNAYLQARGSVQSEDKLFVSKNGLPIDRTVVYRLLRNRQKSLGLRTGAHNIRYTVLNAVERNADAVVARDVAGHTSLSTTNHYMRSSGDERSQAMNALPWTEKLGQKNFSE